MSKNESKTNQRDLQEVWSPDDVPRGVPDGGTKGDVRVRDVHSGASAGETGRSPATARQAAIDRRIKSKKNSCDICGFSFVVGPAETWKTRCGECAPEMRKAMITCPGCGREYEYHKLQVVTMNVSPGKKGGRKFQVRYCNACLNNVKSRADKLSKSQQAEWDDAAKKQRRFSKEMRG